MNCAKCWEPKGHQKNPALKRVVRLELQHERFGESKFRCPVCKAIFFFPLAVPPTGQTFYNAAHA